MQLFVRDSQTLVLDACEQTTIAEVKAAYAARKAYGIDAEQALVLLHHSRQLQDNATLAEAALYDGATLSVCSRLRGGGGDGGSTGAESRSCYLEMYAQRKPDKVNPLEELLARSTRCRLSGERLAPPCVADELGSLFNKEAVVHALLNKTMPAALSHITSLKAVVNLKLEPAHKAGSSSSNGKNGKANGSSSDAADFQCPVTGLELNGRFQFVIHRPTGQVLSERALREAPAAVEELLGGKWAADDLVSVNPQGEELEKRQQVVAAAAAAERAKKKAKKAGKEKEREKAAAAATGDAGGGAGAVADAADGVAAVGSKRPPVAPPAAAAAAADGAAAAKKLKLPAGATPEVYASIFSTGKPKMKETYCCRSASGRGLGM
uniref:Ubiquitin-like domain-containing protein n=1 Tax=Tetradesmus obliquus TaxID=3088 RepID=A0A383WIC7_TETOB|eukprot:jgi/Sobl393_1/14046/SZX76899.1